MKKLLVLSAGVAIAVSVSAQTVIHNPDGSSYRKITKHFKTKPLLELIADRDARMKLKPGYPHPADRETPRNSNPAKQVNTSSTPNFDASRQSNLGTKSISTTMVNEDGSQSTQGGYPEDPNGRIGSNYFVETINSDFAVYNKNGTVKLATTDLTGVFPGTDDDGDPVVMYDKMADRWIITEFDDQGTGNILWAMFCVSETNDPTGSYYEYVIEPDPSLSVMDYPKYTVWADGYYESCNCQNNDDVMVYQRDSMLVGGSAGVIVIPWTPTINPGGNFFCPMFLDCDGTLPPYGSPNYLFYYDDPNWGMGGRNEIAIDKVQVNWNTNSGTVAHFAYLTTTAFNSYFAGGFDADIAEPGSPGGALASQDGFVNFRVPYLRWSSYNSAVLQFPVNVGTSGAPVSGIRWFELHQDTTTDVWSIFQQSTYAPNDGVSRWEGAIAMDQNGGIGLGYSVADGSTLNPGLRYTGRKSCDPLDSMTVTEVNVVSGNALANTPQNGGNRWGDYSALSVDPVDGITFWYCGMYAENGESFGENISSRLFTFQIPGCLTDVPNVSEPTTQLYAYQNGGILEVKATQVPEGQRVVVELFTVEGKRLMQQVMVPSGSNFETSFNVASLAKAIYLIRIGNDSFQRVVKVDIQ